MCLYIYYRILNTEYLSHIILPVSLQMHISRISLQLKNEDKFKDTKNILCVCGGALFEEGPGVFMYA